MGHDRFIHHKFCDITLNSRTCDQQSGGDCSFRAVRNLPNSAPGDLAVGASIGYWQRLARKVKDFALEPHLMGWSL